MMKTPTITAIALLIGTLTPLAAQESAERKPPVGIPNNAKFFKGKWYHVFVERAGWKQARDKCMRLGGQLVSIPDAETQEFVQQIAKGLHLWLGATDEKTEGLWLWADGTEMKFTAWGKSQPDNLNRREHYLDLWDGLWNDSAQNSPLNVGFICEWKDK